VPKNVVKPLPTIEAEIIRALKGSKIPLTRYGVFKKVSGVGIGRIWRIVDGMISDKKIIVVREGRREWLCLP
jgi:hypothetical protein